MIIYLARIIPRLLLYFPSINFNLIKAEILPYGIFYSLIYSRRIPIELFLLILYFLLSAISGVLVNNYVNLFEIIRSGAAYLNPLLLFVVVFRYCSDNHIFSLLILSKKIFWFLIILGFLQYFGVIGFIDPILKFMIPRASSEALGYRGVTLLSSEPARASIELLFIYIILDTGKPFSKTFCFFFFLFFLLILKSATGFLVLSLYLFLRHKYFRYIGSFLLILIFAVFSISVEGRVGQLIGELFRLPLDEALFYLSNTSGNRIVSIYLAWIYAFYNFFGGGLGQWELSSVESLSLSGINYMDYWYFQWNLNANNSLSFRASGFLSNFLFDFGLFGFFVIFSFLYTIIKKRIGNIASMIRDNFPFLFVFIFNFMFVGSVGVLAPWIALSIILRTYDKRD